MATPSLGIQNFFSTTLSSTITASDTTIYLNSVPTPDEGYLVLDLDNSSKEIIYYTSKGANYVTCPSVAAGRGVGVTSAVGHSSGASVRMTVVGEYWEAIQDGSAFDTGSIGAAAYADGWTPVAGTTPNTVTYNGNRSYDLVFNSTNLTTYIGVGDRVRTTRNTSAPTQCTDLESGSSQYYNKTSPSGMTFTDDFVVSAWIKLESYGTNIIASRFNGTSGWQLYLDANGRLTLAGYNAGGSNVSYIISYQSVPLGKWVHVAAQLDMSAFTATTTTSYIMFDGVDIPASVARGGTNPTALVQAGNLEIGASNGGANPFDGKLAQVAIFNAKVTQATIRGYISQGLSGSETSLISAYSFNNSINDLSANANNLTAQGSAVATNADSPFGNQDDGTISATKDYGIVTKAAFSTNTTLTVQVPEGCAIPTSGTVSAFAYSHNKHPYGMPADEEKWTIITFIKAALSVAGPVAGTWYNPNTTSASITIPIGQWTVTWSGNILADRAAAGALSPVGTLSTANNTESDTEFSASVYGNNVTQTGANVSKTKGLSLSASTPYYLNIKHSGAGAANIYINGETQIRAKVATL